MQQLRDGFIIPLVLLLISIAMILTTTIYQRGSLFVPFITTMYKREQAKALAESGIQIAMSQLGSPHEQKKKEAEKKEATPGGFFAMFGMASQESTNLFNQIFPIINRWQTFELKKEKDGVDGIIKIAIVGEEGKININSIYNFKTKKFVGEGAAKGDWKKVMQSVLDRVQKQIGSSINLFDSFEKFLKQRHYRVNDASELLSIEGFGPFATRLFYEPPSISAKDSKNRPLFLLDLFTVYGYDRLQPWLLSDSIRGALGMKRVLAQPQEIAKGLIKQFKPTIDVAKEWKSLFAPLYGIEFQLLPKGIDGLFEATFDPKLFSVVSYGIVGDVTIRVYAILERVRRFAKQKSWYEIKIKKFYWI